MYAFIKLYEISWLKWKENRHYTVYNTVCYKMVLDIAWFEDGFENCIDYIKTDG